ncbi:MAG: tRNA (adenosine(37)-N6)-threonylcarbamoyltransferase complex ATPase subunit type 1 TsaE [candidate division Zixibacteria bacterium]|nr:tRNA (adenosine(37)-N6)-threonylcarbamoyltransferase complex ATPase subunit type 1 TsaE [candidate division Zixibacteria bacterium]MBU1471201.1 tRNA (adenosine(37)-N6)-threonylcarbamoyltransferase complex ATPase subunit type 1 TsaE [candidate division Zixibacteria bacterium]MBU2626454.1 tRNA (adenosine(37)-N6)-threonylcarbamoyltransferase complex ATPase subunit type 1 TsaE [candidate division Zixibacteria bacterium]
MTLDRVTSSPSETVKLGERLAKELAGGLVVGLVGELGAGKTVLIRGICRGLGYNGIVSSPTFSLMNIYSGDVQIYHFDWYRLDGPSDLDDLGFEEYASSKKGICLIEWADRISQAIPPEAILIHLEILSDHERRIYCPK